MADESTTFKLSWSELRKVAGYAAACARPALAIFESERPHDRRPRAAVDAAQAFADGGERIRALRDSRWAAPPGGSGGPRCGPGCRERRCARGRPRGRCCVPPPPAKSYSGQAHPRIGGLCRTRVRTLRRGRSRRRRTSHRAVPDHCASRRGGCPEALSGAPPGGRRVGELIRILDDRCDDRRRPITDGSCGAALARSTLWVRPRVLGSSRSPGG